MKKLFISFALVLSISSFASEAPSIFSKSKGTCLMEKIILNGQEISFEKGETIENTGVGFDRCVLYIKEKSTDLLDSQNGIEMSDNVQVVFSFSGHKKEISSQYSFFDQGGPIRFLDYFNEYNKRNSQILINELVQTD